MPTYPDDLSVLFVWEIASKLFTQEMVSINLFFDCTIIKHFTQFYADISQQYIFMQIFHNNIFFLILAIATVRCSGRQKIYTNN